MPTRIATMQPSTANNSGTARNGFGARLRHERERRQISIASIADSTKILGALLEGLENDDVSRWPIGFYRRAFLRSYATAIGLDPDVVWREFVERFPEPVEAPLAAPPEAASRRARLRVSLSRQVSWFVGGRLIERLPPRCAAVAFDLAVLGAVGICSFVVLGLFWAPLSIAGVFYYCGGILLLGNSPGVCLFAPAAENADKTMPQKPQISQPRENPQVSQMPAKPQPPGKPQMAQMGALGLARSRGIS
jgi:transcriptional regulator with XRE-family HTH domain